MATKNKLDEICAQVKEVGSNGIEEGEDLCLKDAPSACATCRKPLCLRKQVINMVLGNTEEMYCLLCLGNMEGRPAQDILVAARDYIRGRQCFNKEWSKYENGDFCPDRYGCFFQECFADC